MLGFANRIRARVREAAETPDAQTRALVVRRDQDLADAVSKLNLSTRNESYRPDWSGYAHGLAAGNRADTGQTKAPGSRRLGSGE
jgi:hypothetical protein